MSVTRITTLNFKSKEGADQVEETYKNSAPTEFAEAEQLLEVRVDDTTLIFVSLYSDNDAMERASAARSKRMDINKDIFREPDDDNPMMNQNTFDLYENKKAVPTYNNPGMKRKVEETLDSGIFKDSNDLFNRRNSQRQWYTMPNTEAMNKQTEFAKWCYMTPPTCKEGNGLQCANNLHPRLNRNSADIAPPSPA